MLKLYPKSIFRQTFPTMARCLLFEFSYAAQLPCLHEGLCPGRDRERWPLLGRWYRAMESEAPAYSCRLRGDDESWRRVLVMQVWACRMLACMLACLFVCVCVFFCCCGGGGGGVGGGGTRHESRAFSSERQTSVRNPRIIVRFNAPTPLPARPPDRPLARSLAPMAGRVTGTRVWRRRRLTLGTGSRRAPPRVLPRWRRRGQSTARPAPTSPTHRPERLGDGRGARGRGGGFRSVLVKAPTSRALS